jgi:hypothetical protein
VLEEAVSDVFLNGAKPVSEFESDRVATTVKDLRLDPAVSKAVFEEVRPQGARGGPCLAAAPPRHCPGRAAAGRTPSSRPRPHPQTQTHARAERWRARAAQVVRGAGHMQTHSP